MNVIRIGKLCGLIVIEWWMVSGLICVEFRIFLMFFKIWVVNVR